MLSSLGSSWLRATLRFLLVKESVSLYFAARLSRGHCKIWSFWKEHKELGLVISFSGLQLSIYGPVAKGLVALVVHKAEAALQGQIVIPRVAVGWLLWLEKLVLRLENTSAYPWTQSSECDATASSALVHIGRGNAMAGVCVWICGGDQTQLIFVLDYIYLTCLLLCMPKWVKTICILMSRKRFCA